MSKNIDTQFRKGEAVSSSGRLMKRMLQRVFAQLEARMKVTNQQFGVWKQKLADGTEMWLTVNFNGPVPVRRSFVISKPGELVELIGDGDFYLFARSVFSATDTIIYLDEGSQTYLVQDESNFEDPENIGWEDWREGYKTGSFWFDNGEDIVSWWICEGEVPSTITCELAYYDPPPYRVSEGRANNTNNGGDVVFKNGILLSELPEGYRNILGACLHQATNKIIVVCVKDIDEADDYAYLYVLTLDEELNWEEIAGPSSAWHTLQVWKFNSSGTEGVAVGAKELYTTIKYATDRDVGKVTINSDASSASFDIPIPSKNWSLNIVKAESDSSDDLIVTGNLTERSWLNNISTAPGETDFSDACYPTYYYYLGTEPTLPPGTYNESIDQEVDYTFTQTTPVFADYDKNDNLQIYSVDAEVRCQYERHELKTQVITFTPSDFTVKLICPEYVPGECDVSVGDEKIIVEVTGNTTSTGSVIYSESISRKGRYTAQVNLLKNGAVVKSLYKLDTGQAEWTAEYEGKGWSFIHTRNIIPEPDIGRCGIDSVTVEEFWEDPPPNTIAKWEEISSSTPVERSVEWSYIINLNAKDNAISYMDFFSNVTLDSQLLQLPFYNYYYSGTTDPGIYPDDYYANVKEDIREFGVDALQRTGITGFYEDTAGTQKDYYTENNPFFSFSLLPILEENDPEVIKDLVWLSPLLSDVILRNYSWENTRATVFSRNKAGSNYIVNNNVSFTNFFAPRCFIVGPDKSTIIADNLQESYGKIQTDIWPNSNQISFVAPVNYQKFLEAINAGRTL